MGSQRFSITKQECSDVAIYFDDDIISDFNTPERVNVQVLSSSSCVRNVIVQVVVLESLKK